MIKQYPKTEWTYGCEIEIADWDTRCYLPPGSRLGMMRYNIANSSGLGNDPRKVLNIYGGDIKVKVSKSIEEAVESALEVFEYVEPYSINYTCLLHIHIGIPDLTYDLGRLKRISSWIYKNQEEMYKFLPKISNSAGMDIEEREERIAFGLYITRLKKTLRHQMSFDTFNKISEAKFIRDVVEAPYQKDKYGKRSYLNYQVPSIDINQLWKTGSIEFSILQGSDKENHLRSAFLWCEEMMTLMLGDSAEPIEEVWWRLSEDDEDFELAPFEPFNYEIDKIFKKTRMFDRQGGRRRAKDYIENLMENGVINTSDFLPA
jgi:hypothetical protein